MKSTFGRRGLSLFLTLVMCLGMIPAVFAEDSAYAMSLTPPTGLIAGGETGKVLAYVTKDGSGIDVNAADIRWSSSNEAVATISGSGDVTPLSAGTTTITATYTPPDESETDGDSGDEGDGGSGGQTRETEAITETCTVTVNAAPIKPTALSVTLDKTLVTLVVNGNPATASVSATVTPTPADADKDLIYYKWTSNNENIVTISGSGTGASVTLTAQGEGETLVKCEVSADGAATQTVNCRVVVNPPVNSLAMSSTSGTLDVGKQVSVTATPDPSTASVTWESSDEAVATVGSTDANGHMGIIYANRPGTATITATASLGDGNERTGTYNLTVSGLWIDEDKRTFTLQENGSLLLPQVYRYGAASTGNLLWQTSNPAVAQVNGSNIMGRGPGTATLTAYSGTYEISITVTVGADSATTIEYGSLRVDQTLSFNSLLSQIYAQAPGGLSHVTGLSVPTSQGTLFYKYTSSDEPNEGVAQNGSYYYRPGTGQKGLSDVTFVPNPTYGGGSVTISYTVVTTTNQNYSCRIIINVEPNDGTDIVLSATNLDPAWFSSSRFSQICLQETGNTLDYVIFSIPSAREGTLYADFVSTDNYGEKIAPGAQYKTKELDKIAFVPAEGFTGDVTIYYTGRSVSSRGGTFTGKVIIHVSRESISGTDSDLYYNIPQGGTLDFDDAKFNSYYKAITGSSATLSYIQFDSLPSSSQGTLYYNYRSASSPGTRVTAGTNYYYGSRNPRLDMVTFAPTEGFSGTVLIPFTGWDTNNTRFAGTVEINVGSSGGRGDIYYTCAAGRTVTFDINDFTALSRELTGRTLNYIVFQDLPNSSSQGSLYHSNTRISSTGTRYYNSSGTNRIRNLSFHASSSFSGMVNIPFVGYTTSTGETFNGVITIEAADYGSEIIRYTATAKEPAVFDKGDFDDLAQWATRYNVSSVKFDIPATSRGDLYQNYRSLTSKGTRISSSNTSISRTNLDRVAFIPANGFVGTVDIDFTATAASGGGTFTGTVEIVVQRPGADVTVNYSTRVSPVSFRTVDFGRSGYTLSSIQFGAMPSSSAGYLYYRYTSPTQYDRQASTSSVYNVSGSNLISDLTFVPRADFTGTVVIPYTGTNSNRTTFEGEVVITVSPTYTSAYFNDMGGCTNQQRASVDYLYEEGVTNGVSSTQYGPSLNITRGDFAVMLYRAFDLTPMSSGSSFNDVPSSAYYAQAVNTLRAMGVVNGVGKGSYAPLSPVSRQDALCMIQRMMRYVGWGANDGPTSLLYGYGDGGDVAGYAQGAMSYAVMMGYLPLSNGQLAPRANLTRVDMAQTLHRVLTY